MNHESAAVERDEGTNSLERRLPQFTTLNFDQNDLQANSWLPLTINLGLVPLLDSTLPDLRPIDPGDCLDRYDRASRLKINVSGVVFEVSEVAIRRFPNTLLGSQEKEYFYDVDEQCYFFDRDPDLFRYILNYYQTGRIHIPKCTCICAFTDELKFFGISPDNLQDCCYEEYLDKAEDARQRVEENSIKFKSDKSEQALTLRQKICHIFDDPSFNEAAHIVYYTTGFFIILSVLSNMAETVPCHGSSPSVSCGDAYSNIFFCIDTACVLIFTLEYVARLYAAPSRCQYIRSVMALIDLTAILPYYIGLFITKNKHFSGSLVTLRVFRVFRIFKFSRHSQGLRILGCTLKSCARELGFLLFSLTLVVIIFATIIYYIERDYEKSSFSSIPASAWYTIVTMTTLGYGDMVPSTVPGRIVGSFCSLCGVLVIALPVPVIVSNFSRIYHQSQRQSRRAAHQQRRLMHRLHQQNALNHPTVDKRRRSTIESSHVELPPGFTDRIVSSRLIRSRN